MSKKQVKGSKGDARVSQGAQHPPEKKGQDYTLGFADGYEKGFVAGVKSNPDLDNTRRIGFDDGVRHIVTVAENFLINELGVPGREALAKSGKIPAWWIATLVTVFVESPKEPKSFEEAEVTRR